MNVFKFGGASVKDADSVKNVKQIIERYSDRSLIVISAMGKTTDAFERLLHSYVNSDEKSREHLDYIFDFHLSIIKELFPDKDHSIYNELESVFNSIKEILQSSPSANYDYEYDRLVSFGEILSSLILSCYLNANGISNNWLDARKIIKTDGTYRDAAVLWDETKVRLHNALLSEDNQNYVIQGFIGGTLEDIPTTLGREGSDFTAAIVAHCLGVKDVTIWKNVPGILHADPQFFPEAEKIDILSYHDAIELAYYGAKVIHPKTIKPLQNKNIPLFVKSFIEPESPGTVISELQSDIPRPVFIIKRDQVLMTISPYDFSFIAEKNLSEIFSLLSGQRLRLNVMQNSAISFSMSLDYDSKKIDTFVKQLRDSYRVKYNNPVDLITIWHYNEETISQLTRNKEILLEERSRYTVQLVARNKQENA